MTGPVYHTRAELIEALADELSSYDGVSDRAAKDMAEDWSDRHVEDADLEEGVGVDWLAMSDLAREHVLSIEDEREDFARAVHGPSYRGRTVL